MDQKRKYLAEQLSKFVSFNTVTTRGNDPFARYVGDLLTEEGFKVSYQRKREKGHLFTNVIAQKGKGKNPLMLCAHLDTVAAGHHDKWTATLHNPWQAHVKGDFLYGLGSADDKGPLLAVLSAISLYPEEKLKRPILFLGTFGEESGMKGAMHFIKNWRGKKPCAAIVAEPTALEVTYRHKAMGIIKIELIQRFAARSSQIAKNRSRLKIIEREFKGKSAHSSRPEHGENALRKALKYLRAHPELHDQIIALEGGSAANIIPAHAFLQIAKSGGGKKGKLIRLFPTAAVLSAFDAVEEVVHSKRKQLDPSIKPPMLTSNLGILKCEEGKVSLTFDLRLLPSQSFERIYKVLKRKLEGRLGKIKGLRWKVTPERLSPSLGLTQNHFLARLTHRLFRASGLRSKYSTTAGCTEAGSYYGWGVPAIIFGPGDGSGVIHSPNEHIELAQIEKAIPFYTLLIQELAS